MTQDLWLCFGIKNPITTLRHLALMEAVSYLLLLGVAMPLKYIWQMPLAVKLVGSLHGALFVLLCLALLRVLIVARWPLLRAAAVFLASLLPFVPFFLDKWLKRYEEAYSPGSSR